jgi:hypothetical protein
MSTTAMAADQLQQFCYSVVRVVPDPIKDEAINVGVIGNGHPRAALFAIPTAQNDDELPYLYRDRIPTIARDMPEDFEIFAVLPAARADSDERERQFAIETRRLLDQVPRMATLDVSELDTVRPRVERLLVEV